MQTNKQGKDGGKEGRKEEWKGRRKKVGRKEDR